MSQRARNCSVIPDLRTDSDSSSDVDSDSSSENSDYQDYDYSDMPTLSYDSCSANSDSSTSGAFGLFCQNLKSIQNLQVTEDMHFTAESIQTSTVEPAEMRPSAAIDDCA